MKAIIKASDYIDNIVRTIIMLFLIAMTIILFSQVVTRYFFRSGLSWAEEAVRYLCVWVIFFGASCAAKDGSQIAVTALEEALSDKPREVLAIIQKLIVLGYAIIVTWIGIKILKVASTQGSPNMQIPMNYIYLVIPISMSIMVLHTITLFINISGKNNREIIKEGD